MTKKDPERKSCIIPLENILATILSVLTVSTLGALILYLLKNLSR